MTNNPQTKEINNKIKQFFSQFKQKFLNKGEILILSGAKLKENFYLSSGSIKQYTITKKGYEIILNIFKQGTFFPMSNTMNDTTNEYYYEALEKTEVWIAPSDKLITFIQKNPDVLFDLLKRVYKGTDGLLLRMTYLMSGGAYLRLITEILLQTKRFGEKISENTFKLNTTENTLGASSGLTRETVSREMRKLKEKNLVTLNNKHFIIHDLSKLEDELSLGE